MKPPKVSIQTDKKVTVIDNDSGAVGEYREGVLKGFGQGLKDYIARGTKKAMPDIIVNTGQFPDGHAKAGKWAVQVMIDPFDEEEDAATIALRVEAILKKGIGSP